MAIRLLSVGVSPTDEHPMLWAWFNERWVTETEKLTAPEITDTIHPALDKLPTPLCHLVHTLAKCDIITFAQITPFLHRRGFQSSLCLQAHPTQANMSVVEPLARIVKATEALCPDWHVLRQPIRCTRCGTMEDLDSAIYVLCMRWQNALKRLVALG